MPTQEANKSVFQTPHTTTVFLAVSDVPSYVALIPPQTKITATVNNGLWKNCPCYQKPLLLMSVHSASWAIIPILSWKCTSCPKVEWWASHTALGTTFFNPCIGWALSQWWMSFWCRERQGTRNHLHPQRPLNGHQLVHALPEWKYCSSDQCRRQMYRPFLGRSIQKSSTSGWTRKTHW